MKILLTLALTGLSLGVAAGELDSITLITPTPYKKASTFSQTIGSKMGTKLGALVNYDVEKTVMKAMEPKRKALQKYFPKTGELDAFVKSITQEGIRKHLNPLNDDNLVSFHGFIEENLIGKMADKILLVEGVSNSSRRDLWVTKMLEPARSCITTSLNGLFDADHCTTALIDSLVPSMGIGLAYELSRENLNSALPEEQRTPFNLNQANSYKACLAKTKATSDDVEACVLSIMKSGVLKVTDQALTSTINKKSSSLEAADNVKKTVWPSFVTCTNSVGNNPALKVALPAQFMNCIDDLVSNTGSLIIQDKITTTPVITKLFPAADVKKLSLEKSTQFKKCAAEQKAKGAKKDGMLDIDPCENAATNEITYKVVAETFRETARTSIKDNKSQAASIGNDGVALLDKCWDNKQTPTAREACLKKSIVTYSQIVAVIKLDGAIPKTMTGRDALSKSSIADLTKCLDKELPANISEADELLTQSLDGCTGKLTRSVALKVADFQIRDTAKGNLSEKDTDKLVEELVTNEFAKCIGALPSDEALEKCGDVLTIKAAKHIAEISFHKEVYDYLKSSGGLEALKLEQSSVSKFLSDLNKSNRECIDTKVSGPAMDQVNLCIKGSIKKIAYFFADLKFNQSVGDMYKGRDADRKIVDAQFKKDLSECLDTKNGKEFSITDYTANLYTCSDKVASSTTINIGQDQVNTALDSYLKDRPGINLKEKRNALKTELLGNFQKCMSNEKNQNICIDNLKKESTRSIVIAYGQVETQAQLNAVKLPPEIKPVEKAFIACTDSDLEGEALGVHLDECTKDFALNFAKELGALKLNYLLKQALGSADFDKQKNNIQDSIAKYNVCLKDLKKYNMSEGLTDKLTVCTDGLTARGMTIVRSSINTWMTSDQKDAATVMLKQEFANFLPCLSALLPTSPYTQELQANIDSSVKPLAVLLAHYIEYNPENAKQTLEGVIEKLSVDFNDVAQTQKAKADLLNFLYQSGGLDQFLKAIVRGTVKDAIALMDEKDISAELRGILLNKQSFETMFNTPEGSRIKDAVMEKILKPTLLENADLKGIAYKANMEAIKDNVVRLLVNAPTFGEKAISVTIQGKMNEMNGFTKFVVKNFIGSKDSLDWEKVRKSPAGIEAEVYIKEQYLIPKFRGDVFTAEQEKKVMKHAEDMVTTAVKNYGKK